MKVYQALLPLVAAMAMVGCGSRGAAQSMVGQADGLVSKVREEAEISAPAELKATETTLAHMQKNFNDRDYKAVKAEVPAFNEQLETLRTAVKTKQDANAAASGEWTTLNTEVPKSVEAIQARVDSLKPEALPKEVTKEELETAKTELEVLKTTWAEATAAASANNTAEAAEKGRAVQAKAEDLKNQLGMNPTVASTG